FQLGQLRHWLGTLPANPGDDQKTALATVAGRLWSDWQNQRSQSGRHIFDDALPVLALWTATPDEFAALVAPAMILDPQFHEAAAFPAALVDGEGRLLLGDKPFNARLIAMRAPSSTKLPWTVEVASSDDGTVQVAGRRWLLGSAFLLLLALLAGVSVVIVRA